MNKALPILLSSALWLVPGAVSAGALDGEVAQRVHSLALEASRHAAQGLRVEVHVGQLDPRLKLAPCTNVQPYLPAGVRLWGAARIGLRCADTGARWNVFLPVTVNVFGPGLTAKGPLAAGTVIAAADLQIDTVNLAASPAPVLASHELAVGRALTRAVAAGEALRATDLRARQWFAAGDTVRIVAGGVGWRIRGEGQALNPGIEGQPVRVRTESGRVVSGVAIAERQVEVPL